MRVQAAAQSAGLDLASTRRVGDGIYLARRGEDELCMVNTSHGLSFGCALRSRFFDGNAVRWGMAESGSPNAPSDITLAGVGRAEVASVRVVLPSGVVSAKLNGDKGFSIHLDVEKLAGGPPTAIQAVNSKGKVISSEALPKK